MIVAFYKGKGRVYNRIVRWWDQGKYSHVEIVFNDGMAASSSYMDGGVRFKRINFNLTHWDFIELPAYLEPSARAWFVAHEGDKYDTIGNLRFLFDFMSDDSERHFCSEAIAAALGINEAWRYSPNGLHSALVFYYKSGRSN